MDSHQSLSPAMSPDETGRPESPLTGLEFDMSRLSLEAENEELKEKLQELQFELLDEKSQEQYLRREQLVEAKQIREEERKRAHSMVTEVRMKLYKEKQREVHELREKLLKEKDKEIAHVIKQRDEDFRKAQLNWNREKEDLVQKLRVQVTNEIRDEAQKSHEKQMRKLEVCIEELKMQKKQVEESCKLAQDADKKKVSQIRRMHSEHEQELTKLKRSSWQEGRKQMAEIRQLINIIHQLEKKLGVESGHYIRLQLEKDCLRDKLDRVKGNEISGRRSPLSSSRTDLSSDLSMFNYPSMDDSNPLWLQIKQQKCTIAQLRQNIQDKSRRIDLLKQKLFKNRSFGQGGLMHFAKFMFQRSMDDMLAYESASERDDCISPLFGYSTGSSDTSSLNEEAFQSDENQDVEIIRRLQKELLQLQKSHSLLQAQNKSNVDAGRTQMHKEQLQMDLVEAQRQLDELNKDLVESHDRNELLEFQLQEALQQNFVEGKSASTFKVPMLCIDYQFSDEELLCSAEEMKARLEELENEKKPVLNRDEQLTLQQVKRLLGNISTSQEHGSQTFSFDEVHTAVDNTDQKDFLQLPVFYDTSSDDSFLEDTDVGEYIMEDVEPAVECDIDRDNSLGDVPIDSNDFNASVFVERVQSHNVGVQTDLHKSPGELSFKPNAAENIKKIDTAVQCAICSPVTDSAAQCNILDIESCHGGVIITFGSDSCKFKKVVESSDIGIQVGLEEVRFTREGHLPQEETLLCTEEHSCEGPAVYTPVDSAVQCNIMEISTCEDEIIEIFNEFESLRFKKIPVSTDNAVQTDVQEYDVIDDDVMFDDVIDNDVIVDDVIDDDILIDDIIGNGVIVYDLPEVEEDGVREKHDGEPSEKTLLGLGWKDFVDGAELGEDAKLLDCLVYEQEDVFIVVCESYRKYCKEISKNDYTFDFDDNEMENVAGEFLEACNLSEKQIKHIQPSNDFIGDDHTLVVKVDNNYNDAGESDYSEVGSSEVDRKNFQTLGPDNCNKVSEAIELNSVSPKVVDESSFRKCETGIQCDILESKNVEQKVDTCPHCMKPLSASPGNEMYIINETGDYRSSPGVDDAEFLYSQSNTFEGEHVTGNGEGDEAGLIEDSPPVDIGFAFREMCDFSVQCELRDGIDLPPREVPCLLCGHSKFSCSDVGIQCEFADLLSSSNGMLDISGISEFPGVLQEDEGESLIKEVMALAKECSQNDALIDQHLSEVVRGQGLFNLIQDEDGERETTRDEGGYHEDEEGLPRDEDGFNEGLPSDVDGDYDGEEEIPSDQDVRLQTMEDIGELEQKETEENEVYLPRPEVIKAIHSDVPLEISPYSLRCDKETQYTVEDVPRQFQETLFVTSSTQYSLEDIGLLSDDHESLTMHGRKQNLAESVTDQSRKKTSVDVGTQYVCEIISSSLNDDGLLDPSSGESDEWPQLPEEIVGHSLDPEKGISDDEALESNDGRNDSDLQEVDGSDIPEQSRDLYSEIPNSELRVLSEEEDVSLDGSKTTRSAYDGVISEEEMKNVHWREVKDAGTQCEGDDSLERRHKAVQCKLLDDGQQFGFKMIVTDEELADNKLCLTSQEDDDHLFKEEEDSVITEGQGKPRSETIHTLSSTPQVSEFETSEIAGDSNGGMSGVIAESAVPIPTLDIDLDDVFNEMEAHPAHPPPAHPPLPVTLTPKEIASPSVSDEYPNLTRQPDAIARSPADEPMVTRTSKADTLHAFDDTLLAFVGEDPGHERRDDDMSYATVTSEEGLDVREITKESKTEDIDISQQGEGSEFSEETSSSETSSQVTVESNGVRQHSVHHTLTHMQPTPPMPENPPPFQNNHPPATEPEISDTCLFPKADNPPPLPDTLPPTLPSISPPSVMHSDFDDDIEALLAGELDQYTGDLTPIEVKKPVGVRPTLDHEIQAMLESEDSSVRSEPTTVLSMDSLYMNQTAPGSNTQPGGGQTVDTSTYQDNTDVFNDETEMITSSFDNGDVIDDVTSITDDVISESYDDAVFERNDRLLYASVEGLTLETHPKRDRNSRHGHDNSHIVSVGTKRSPGNESLGKRVAFQSEISDDSATESSSVGDVAHRRQPPPVLPKPKYRSHSMNLPVSELPPVPTQGERPNSMAARRDIVDGYFPPAGLVPKRASEFNHGEFDLLKERIVYMERQLKNKENLLQSMRAEATEIETNAYIQKKEEDIKMMDESVRFLKVENQKKERELVAKIGELNKYTFELEQLRSERTNAERQREILEDNVNSLQDRVSQLQSVQVQYQELRCKCESLVNENTHLHEQVSRLHRADEEFVELERTISKLQGKLKELEDVKRERDDISEQLKTLKSQKDDLTQKGRKVETERNDFLVNNKLMHQQKENLEARNNALQRTNDTFKTKISSLEKECRDSQRKLFGVQRDRDEGSSQLRKLEAERNELRKRVNELIECKSELKQYHSKSQDLERELNYLRTQCKKVESERTELSTELGNCLKERNRLEGRTAELEKLTRDNEKLEEKFHALKLKIAELTSQRDDAEVQLPTLKAKVALLKKACKEKDDQLDKLKSEIRELKHSIASSALDDLSSIPFGFDSPNKSVKFQESSDLNNNHIPLAYPVHAKRFVVLFDYDPARLSTTGHPERELKLNEGDVITVNSDLDLNGYYMGELNGKRGLVSSLYIEEMDEYEMRKLKKQRELNTSKSPSKKADPHSIPPMTSSNMPGLVKRSFVALRDYNPFTSSTSTRPDLELPLAAGEVVIVVGDVDANGYYTVEKGGRLAIIPSNLVKPNSPSLTRPSKLNFTAPVQTTGQVTSVRSQEETQGSSTRNAFTEHYPSHSSVVPRQSSVIHAAPPGSTPYPVTEHVVRHTSVENILNTQNTSTTSTSVGRRTAEGKTMNISSVLPSAPRNLRVLRCVNKDALLLGWVTPDVDELARNNGQLIKGYKILANGQPKLDVDSPYMAKALIENLDLSRPVELAIQTVADNGFCSEKTVTHFNEAVMMETTSVTTEDVSHLDNSLPYRTFVALFSYDPLKSSPNPNPTFELEFQEGDIVRVADTSRPDGYYTGQVNGNEGLVPSNFLEEIAVATRSQARKRDKELQDSNASLRSTSSLSPKKAKAMVALYDYNPTIQSPNKHPERELCFRKGQIVRVLDSMRSDGFYEADINGQRGLVPSSFLKPCKRKTTKSASVPSTNGFASLPRRVQFAHEQDSRHVTAGYV